MGIAYGEGDIDTSGAEQVNLQTSTGVELLGQKVSSSSIPVVLASDQSKIPTSVFNSSSGYQLAINTDGSINVTTSPSDPVSVILQATSTARNGFLYFTNTGFNSISTPTETAYFLLKNPSGSGKTATLEQIVLTTDENIGATYRLRIYLDPTITANGTSLTPVNARQTGTVAVSSTTYRSPTISANGTLLFVTNTTIGSNSIESGSILLDPNHNYLITVQTDNTANFNLLVIFSEETGI